MTEPQLPPARRRTVPPLPDPMAPLESSSLPPGSAPPPGRPGVGAPPVPALGVVSTVAISVRTSAEIRAMFDALAADDARRDQVRVNQRATLDRIVAAAYHQRFSPTGP